MSHSIDRITRWVDGARDAALPPRQAATAQRQATVSALVQRALAAPVPDHKLLFMAERVIARAQAAPAEPWYRSMAAAVVRPMLFAVATAAVLAAVIVVTYSTPSARKALGLGPSRVRSFVIYRAADGQPVSHNIEYRRVTSVKNSDGST
jgi:hypothetical protein